MGPGQGAARGELLTGHTGPVRSVAFGALPDGTPLLASGGGDGTVRLWDPGTGTARGDPLTGHTLPVRSVAFGALPDGTPLLASGGDDGMVRLWALGTTAVLPARDAIVSGDDEEARDDLGREVLAAHLVGVVDQLVASRGGADRSAGTVVVKVDGRWGSGKSILSRLFAERLAGGSATATARLADPVVVRFDTWRESTLGPA